MMRYVAIDIETTGLDPERCQVLEIAAVVETDWLTPVDALPVFRRVVWHDEVRGEPFALAMNAHLIEELAAMPAGARADLDGHLIDLGDFIHDRLGRGPVTIAGKNFGSFDYRFLSRSPEWRACVAHRHRVIDVGNLFWDAVTDDKLPDLAECQRRAGLPVREGHRAVEDCRAVVACVRAKWGLGIHTGEG